MVKYFLSQGSNRVQVEGTWPKTRVAALRESIRKWEFVVKELEASPCRKIVCDAEGCALCQLYLENNCIGCPVKKNIGLSYCVGTPFKPIPTLQDARSEVAFLKSLLPNGRMK